MLVQPGFHVGVLVGGIVVDDQMDGQVLVGPTVEQFQEFQKLIIAVLGQTLADHRALMDIEGGEQGGGAVTIVVMGIVPFLPGFIGKPGCVRSSACLLYTSRRG